MGLIVLLPEQMILGHPGEQIPGEESQISTPFTWVTAMNALDLDLQGDMGSTWYMIVRIKRENSGLGVPGLGPETMGEPAPEEESKEEIK